MKRLKIKIKEGYTIQEVNTNQKEAGAAVLKSVKTDFKVERISGLLKPART